MLTMPDWEKVMKGLECCLAGKYPPCGECDYYGDMNYNDPWSCRLSLMADALALLKAQEPIAPIQGADDQDEYIFCCGSCGAVVGETFLGPSGGGEVREKYCPECGRAVKWE